MNHCVKYIAAILAAGICAGCHRPSGPEAKPLTAAAMRPVVQKAVQACDPETKTQADRFAAAMENHDVAAAFTEIHDLATRPDLTPEQRQALSGVMAATLRQLQTAAAGGDPRAVDAWRHYKATR